MEAQTESLAKHSSATFVYERNTLEKVRNREIFHKAMGFSNCHSFYLLLPAFLLLLVILCSSPFNTNHFTQLFTSFSPFNIGENNHSTTPHDSLDAFLSTSMYKSSKQKAAIIEVRSISMFSSFVLVSQSMMTVFGTFLTHLLRQCFYIGRKRATRRGLKKI